MPLVLANKYETIIIIKTFMDKKFLLITDMKTSLCKFFSDV